MSSAAASPSPASPRAPVEEGRSASTSSSSAARAAPIVAASAATRSRPHGRAFASAERARRSRRPASRAGRLRVATARPDVAALQAVGVRERADGKQAVARCSRRPGAAVPDADVSVPGDRRAACRRRRERAHRPAERNARDSWSTCSIPGRSAQTSSSSVDHHRLMAVADVIARTAPTPPASRATTNTGSARSDHDDDERRIVEDQAVAGPQHGAARQRRPELHAAVRAPPRRASSAAPPIRASACRADERRRRPRGSRVDAQDRSRSEPVSGSEPAALAAGQNRK